MTTRPHFLFLIFLLLWPLAGCPSTATDRSGRNSAEGGMTVSREVYDRTFSEVLTFLKKMDAIIATRNFEAWKANCTPEYLAYYSDPARLAEISQMPRLKEHGIVVASLEDFFKAVFIPSRTEAILDKIDFIDNRRVKAVTVINGVAYVLYLLEKDQNNQWKIGVW
jgi:hypothetical protein